MKVRYSKGAVADLIAIADYIRDRNPRAAEAVERRIRASIDQLEMFPLLGRPTDDPSIRMFPIVRYPYLVFYEVGGQRDRDPSHSSRTPNTDRSRRCAFAVMQP